MVSAKSGAGKAVVIGAGTMGGGIAAQLANAGWQVWLLDVAGADEKARSQAATAGIARVMQAKPPLLFLPEFAARIRAGNIEDDLGVLRDADWVVEAIVERMEAKQALLAQVEAQCGPETIVSSNTSGLSLGEMTAGRSPEFRSRFLGTHFLNPPRYLKLLEVIPLPETAPEVVSGFREFAERALGHRAIFARDTPGFISTRLWITHLLDTIHTVLEFGLTVEEVDALTGPLLGRPRSATFRMADIVGLDIIANVARNQFDRLPDDPMRERLRLPEVMQNLLDSGRLGEKSGGGFYRRDGKAILALDLKTGEYRPRQEAAIEAAETLARLPLPERLQQFRHMLLAERLKGKAPPWADFLWRILVELTGYVEQVGPEIATDALAIDRVMQWGFHWEMGPCAMADALFAPNRDAISEYRRNYGGTGGARTYRVFGQEEMLPMPEEKEYIVLADLKAAGRAVLDSEVATLIDLGDGVACLEYHTKMNTFSPALVRFLNAARERAEEEFAALVIGNQGPHFSAGYNLNLFLEAIAAEDWNALDAALREVQFAFLGLKYARIPIVGAPHGYTLGAGCEGALHCHALHAAPELAMGLPERNVGVIPAGGGAKEMLARAMAEWDGIGDAFPHVERVFDLLAFPKNSGSAEEARQLGLLRPGDTIARNADRQLFEAKERALALANAGWQPRVKENIRVLGADALARLRLKIHPQYRAGVLTEHDRRIADGIALILSGGGLPYPQEVREEVLLQLERDVFIALAREPKTAERMRHVLETGKPLKN